MNALIKAIRKKARETGNETEQTHFLSELLLHILQLMPRPATLINTPIFHNLVSFINYVFNSDISAMENAIQKQYTELSQKQAVQTILKEKLAKNENELQTTVQTVEKLEKNLSTFEKMEAIFQNYPELERNVGALENKLQIMENLTTQIPDLNRLQKEAEASAEQLRSEILRIQKIQNDAKEAMRRKQNEGV